LPEGGWLVPFSYVLELIGAFVAILVAVWMGVVVRVFVNNERRLVTLEAYADPRSEQARDTRLMLQFQVMLKDMELRLGNNLEAKRSSIESTIKQQVGEVVEAMKNGGT
jgi:hypothetical protein